MVIFQVEFEEAIHVANLIGIIDQMIAQRWYSLEDLKPNLEQCFLRSLQTVDFMSSTDASKKFIDLASSGTGSVPRSFWWLSSENSKPINYATFGNIQYTNIERFFGNGS